MQYPIPQYQLIYMSNKNKNDTTRRQLEISIILLGASNVGKTSFDCRFKIGVFPFELSEYYDPTIDTSEIFHKWITIDDNKYDIDYQLLDFDGITNDEYAAMRDVIIKENNRYH